MYGDFFDRNEKPCRRGQLWSLWIYEPTLSFANSNTVFIRFPYNMTWTMFFFGKITSNIFELLVDSKDSFVGFALAQPCNAARRFRDKPVVSQPENLSKLVGKLEFDWKQFSIFGWCFSCPETGFLKQVRSGHWSWEDANYLWRSLGGDNVPSQGVKPWGFGAVWHPNSISLGDIRFLQTSQGKLLNISESWESLGICVEDIALEFHMIGNFHNVCLV